MGNKLTYNTLLMMSSSFFSFKNNRQRPPNLIIKPPTATNSPTPLPVSSRKLESPSQVTKTEELISDYSLTILKIKRSNHHNLNLSPLHIAVSQKNQVDLPSPIGPEENLFLPVEPRIQTKKTLKIRAETPTPSIFKEVQKTNWMFKSSLVGEPRVKPRVIRFKSRGKVYKGRCQYPKSNNSPTSLYNLKLARENLR